MELAKSVVRRPNATLIASLEALEYRNGKVNQDVVSPGRAISYQSSDSSTRLDIIFYPLCIVI
jgi:hypothetical protein